mmetsp:Transcript_173850/g.422838  ORF Transcript_173850/g.422838 Transcript_173850/m.422838 type:complete len:388 (-) Transcript_173850:563-1726(-)
MTMSVRLLPCPRFTSHETRMSLGTQLWRTVTSSKWYVNSCGTRRPSATPSNHLYDHRGAAAITGREKHVTARSSMATTSTAPSFSGNGSAGGCLRSAGSTCASNTARTRSLRTAKSSSDSRPWRNAPSATMNSASDRSAGSTGTTPGCGRTDWTNSRRASRTRGMSSFSSMVTIFSIVDQPRMVWTRSRAAHASHSSTPTPPLPRSSRSSTILPHQATRPGCPSVRSNTSAAICASTLACRAFASCTNSDDTCSWLKRSTGTASLTLNGEPLRSVFRRRMLNGPTATTLCRQFLLPLCLRPRRTCSTSSWTAVAACSSRSNSSMNSTTRLPSNSASQLAASNNVVKSLLSRISGSCSHVRRSLAPTLLQNASAESIWMPSCSVRSIT